MYSDISSFIASLFTISVCRFCQVRLERVFMLVALRWQPYGHEVTISSLSTHSQHLVELADVENGFRNKLSDQYIQVYSSTCHTFRLMSFFCLFAFQANHATQKPRGGNRGFFKRLPGDSGRQSQRFGMLSLVARGRRRHIPQNWENVILVLMLVVFFGRKACVFWDTF